MKYKELKCRVYCCCVHCGERYCGNASGGCAMHCQNCKTAQGRRELDEENKKLADEK